MSFTEKGGIIDRLSRLLAMFIVMLAWLTAAPIATARTDTATSPPIRFDGTPWEQAAHREGIAPGLLYALALTRSGKIGEGRTAAPWPWTLIIGETPRQYASRAEAEAAMARFDQHTELGVGMTGLLVRMRPGAAAAGLLDSATNLRRAAAALAERLRAAPQDPALAVGRVAHPNDPTAARTLGRRVLAIAAALDDAGPARGTVAIRTYTGVRPAAAETDPIVGMVRAAAVRHGIDPAFALAIAQAESGFRHAAVSPKGARGVMQLMPGTAARYGANPRDLGQNIEAGVRYLRDLAELFDGDPALVAAGYNAGERAVIRYGRVPPYPETQRYVPRVLAAREGYR
jgi:soluble lytic murein transglycosylase-like protein